MTRTPAQVMEPATLAEFPFFRDGDVAIAFNTRQVYRLHSSLLKRNSTFFAKQLQEPGAKLNKQAREEGAAAYRLEYRKNEGEGRPRGYWIRKEVNERGRFDSSSGLFPDFSNGKLIDPEHRSWEWLFGIFYNQQPAFDDETLGSLLCDCMGLIEVAERVGSADHVRKIVDLALLQQDECLWSSISKNPCAWAELAYRIHSQAIFKESICHIVGQWLLLKEEEKANLSDDIRSLCVAKFEELDVAKQAIQMRILGHYPAFLYRDAADRPGRPSYANDIYMWMALDFFRQWFTQNIMNGNDRTARDGGWAFYHNLSQGGSAYLDHEDFRNFHQYFPMSSKACAVLERDMGVLKEDVKPFVQDLLKSQIRLDLTISDHINWLTCTVVSKDDCPWVKKEKAEREEASAAKQRETDELMFEDTPLAHHSRRNRSNSLFLEQDVDAEYEDDDDE